MSNYLKDKVIIVTGAASGFGKLIATKAAAQGAKVACADINGAGLDETVSEIVSDGGQAISHAVDVTSIDHMRELAARVVDAFGRIDVMINNAGVMPLAFYSDHEAAIDKWHRCIDINIKGVLNGIVATFDQMMSQGHGHVINISSIYSNYPVAGGGVYQATKSAVNYLSESLRVEARGKIKVTVVRPTAVTSTGLMAGIVNPAAAVGIVGHNASEFTEFSQRRMAGTVREEELDPESGEYSSLKPSFIAEAVIHAINQPKGVVIGDVTVRATGDYLIL
ncbi:MAG: SDR family oxidoreductase, partial [Gammaproteobacteria bacterium]|nr:SDR family oxidoreductase [Gammaproteobacteria bacterium]